NLVSLRRRAARLPFDRGACPRRRTFGRSPLRRPRGALRSGDISLLLRGQVARLLSLDAGAQHVGIGRGGAVQAWWPVPLDAPGTLPDAGGQARRRRAVLGSLPRWLSDGAPCPTRPHGRGSVADRDRG